MMHWPNNSPLEENRNENEIRPFQYKKAKLKRMFVMEDYRARWLELKFNNYLRRRGGLVGV